MHQSGLLPLTLVTLSMFILFALIWTTDPEFVLSLLSSRYCTEILASLPFTSPDEPLYLIYSINRIIQVRAGTVEANMKGFLQFLQAGSQKINGSGSIQTEPTQPIKCETEAMVTNEILEGLERDRVCVDYGSVDSYMPHLASLNPHGISNVDLHMIQVCSLHQVQSNHMSMVWCGMQST